MPRLHVMKVSLLAAVLGVFTGCVGKTYDLRLVPHGESMQRTLTVSFNPSREGDDASPLSDTELAHMREFYDPAMDRIQGGSHTFVGAFRGEMPADVGGAGEYALYESPLGSTSLYSERFRGEDDLQQNMSDRNAAVDRLVDLLLNWSQEEFAGQPILPRVERLLDQDVRRDLKNLSVYCWTHVMVVDVDEEVVGQRFMARMGQYLVERNYFSLADLPNMVRVFQGEDQAATLGLFRDAVIRKLQIGGDESAVASLAILGDAEGLASSLRESIRKTEAYQMELAKYKSEHNLDEGADVKDSDFGPLSLLVENAFQAMLPNAFGNTSISVTLQSSARPFATNGTWNAGQGSVEWSSRIAEGDVPALFFSAWSTPDDDAQQQCFGETILTGEPLARFVFWYRGLTDMQRQQYDAFQDTLAPGRALVEKIDAFDWVGDEKLAEVPRLLLRDAIEGAH